MQREWRKKRRPLFTSPLETLNVTAVDRIILLILTTDFIRRISEVTYPFLNRQNPHTMSRSGTFTNVRYSRSCFRYQVSGFVNVVICINFAEPIRAITVKRVSFHAISFGFEPKACQLFRSHLQYASLCDHGSHQREAELCSRVQHRRKKMSVRREATISKPASLRHVTSAGFARAPRKPAGSGKTRGGPRFLFRLHSAPPAPVPSPPPRWLR